MSQRGAAREVFQKALLSYSVPSTSKHKRKTLGKSKLSKPIRELKSKENYDRRALKPKRNKTSLSTDLKHILGHSPLANATNIPHRQHAISEPLPMTVISAKLSNGLATEKVFPTTNYLKNTTAAVHKSFMQSYPESYESRKAYFKGNNAIFDDLLEYGPEPQQSEPSERVNTSPFELGTLGTLNIETASDESPQSQTDLYDELLTITKERLGWLVSPIQRPKMFPQKLF